MRGTAVRRAVFAGRARPSVPSYLFYLRAVMRSPNASSDPPTPCWSLPRTPPHTLLYTQGPGKVEIVQFVPRTRWPPSQVAGSSRVASRERARRSEEHTSELQSPVHLVC